MAKYLCLIENCLERWFKPIKMKTVFEEVHISVISNGGREHSFQRAQAPTMHHRMNAQQLRRISQLFYLYFARTDLWGWDVCRPSSGSARAPQAAGAGEIHPSAKFHFFDDRSNCEERSVSLRAAQRRAYLYSSTHEKLDISYLKPCVFIFMILDRRWGTVFILMSWHRSQYSYS